MTARTSRRHAPEASSSTPLRPSEPSASPLREAKRRVSLARIGVWTALAAGPVALVVACAMPRTVVAAAQPKAAVAAAVRTVDPSGVAALFCDLWLRSDDAAPDSQMARMVHTLAPDVALPSHAGAVSAQPVQSVMAVRSERLEGGRWSVVVAAQFTVRDEDAGDAEAGKASRAVKYFAVPMVAKESAGGAGAFLVTAPPARVAGPIVAAGVSPFENRLPADSELVASLGEFFGAYLAGVGGVDRYLSPDTELAVVADAGYTAVRVEEVSADSEMAAGPVPENGTSVRVQARVTALAAKAEQWPLAYELTMTARSGRWEVTALHAGADPAAKPSTENSAAAGGEEQ